MCSTRWVQQIHAIEIFKSLHQSIVGCTESICSDSPGLWNADSITDVRGLQLAITTIDFLCVLAITNSCLKYVQALTTNLQAESRDIVCAVREIETVTATIQDVRDNVQTHHSKCFSPSRICAQLLVPCHLCKEMR